jgi:uncharacterized protein HemX
MERMAAPSAIDNLKTKPKDEKTAVAGGVASLVVILLLVGWVIYFFNKIRSGAQEVNLDGISNQINMPTVRDANRNLQSQFGSVEDEYARIRDAAAAQQAGNSQQQVMQVETGVGGSGFNSGFGQ